MMSGTQYKFLIMTMETIQRDKKRIRQATPKFITALKIFSLQLQLKAPDVH